MCRRTKSKIGNTEVVSSRQSHWSEFTNSTRRISKIENIFANYNALTNMSDPLNERPRSNDLY